MKRDEFVTADTHFGHKGILRYTGRPYDTVQKMDDDLVRRWNEKVPENAIVYHLGDFAFSDVDTWWQLVARLNGRIRLVIGNHDERRLREVKDAFEWTKYYYECQTDTGILVVMCHYPFMTWNKSHHGAWHLHGHSHGSLPDTGTTRMDVGIDTNSDLVPYSYEEVEDFFKGRKYKATDRHGT